MAQVEALGKGAGQTTQKARSTYFWLCFSCLAIALIGFLPTYWAGMARGGFPAHPVIHVHALILYAWVAFLTFQSWLVMQGRVMSHRDWGMAGISLGTLVTVTGLLAGIDAGKRGIAAGYEEGTLAFIIVPFTVIVLFAGIFTAAIMNIHKPETHKRLMLAATASMLGAPVARWFIVLLAPPVPPGVIPGPPPVEVTVLPALIGDIPMFVALFMDWRAKTSNRVFIIAAAIAVGVQLFAVPISKTEIWQSFAAFYVSFGG